MNNLVNIVLLNTATYSSVVVLIYTRIRFLSQWIETLVRLRRHNDVVYHVGLFMSIFCVIYGRLEMDNRETCLLAIMRCYIRPSLWTLTTFSESKLYLN